jgi:hypothetical protein
MSIWKTKVVRERTRITVLCPLVCLGLSVISFPAWACSCNWNGPFLAVAKDVPLIIVGRILRHHSGQPPTMDVLVKETLKGGILDSGMVIQMGDGMHCRPSAYGFPPETEWILALNGPGAKPGRGWAISHCGEYWLRIEDGHVVGSIDGTQGQVNRMPMREFRMKLLYPRFGDAFSGVVEGGKIFRKPFGSRFVFMLVPNGAGWEIVVQEYGRDENLARLTLPLHFVPNPREIEGWHLLEDPSKCSSRSYRAESGPENPRKFIFSPEVGMGIAGEKTERPVTPDDIEAVSHFGRGKLKIEDFKLGDGRNGCPNIQWMKFSVEIEGGV